MCRLLAENKKFGSSFTVPGRKGKKRGQREQFTVGKLVLPKNINLSILKKTKTEEMKL